MTFPSPVRDKCTFTLPGTRKSPVDSRPGPFDTCLESPFIKVSESCVDSPDVQVSIIFLLKQKEMTSTSLPHTNVPTRSRTKHLSLETIPKCPVIYKKCHHRSKVRSTDFRYTCLYREPKSYFIDPSNSVSVLLLVHRRQTPTL